MKSEADVKKFVRELLKESVVSPDMWWYMPAANGFGTPGIPDFVGCYMGRTFAVETKFGKNALTSWQVKQRDTLRAAGGKYWTVSEKNADEFALEFHAWMGAIKHASR